MQGWLQAARAALGDGASTIEADHRSLGLAAALADAMDACTSAERFGAPAAAAL
jgi:hypothetical protein